ncbi:AAA family ATPase [Haloglycomyces albus]|uniref:AAA family ATPase n=1 Tax=Haloglycomyces albus TaxID=526067 RepID=UPI00046D34CE|nr:AAA family ATPase [Haloglycomyces albus]
MTSIELITARARAGLESRRGIVRLHPEIFTALGLQPGDAITMRGRHTTTAIAFEADRHASRRSLYADDLTLGNLGVRENTEVDVSPAQLTAAQNITIDAPASIVAGVDTEILRRSLLSKVVTEGDDISLLPIEIGDKSLAGATRRTLNNTLGMGWTSFILTATSTDPDGPVMITNDTRVQWLNPMTHRLRPETTGPRLATAEGDRAPHSVTSAPSSPQAIRPTPPRAPAINPGTQTSELPDNTIPYADLAGYRQPAEELRELLDLAFFHSEVLTVVGTKVRLGIMMTGPSGTGKSTIVNSVVNELGINLHELSGPDLAAMDANAAAGQLRDTRGNLNGHSVLLLRNVDAIAPEDKPTPLSTMFTRFTEEILESGNAVICTTTNIDAVSRDLRAALEHEVIVDLPDLEARRDILTYLTKSMKLDDAVDLDAIAARAQGYVAADLDAVIREAGVKAALRAKDGGATALQTDDLTTALDTVSPSALADDHVDLGGLTLADVGGMHDLKQSLTETILWPLSYPDAFTRLGIEPPRGILLYGPPGCGKTYIVRAVAGEGQANVITVKGSELLNKWVGESERNVRELFRRARAAAPTLMFFDEIDALVPQRGGGSDNPTADRVVAALLTELDGAESLHDVVIVGATNRPDIIDPALLRPGRLERLLYVPPPDAEGRADILRAGAKNVPFSEDVNLDELADELWLYSAADCSALVREAALTAMRESLDASVVTMAHLESARQRIRPSLDMKQLEDLENYSEKRNGM